MKNFLCIYCGAPFTPRDRRQVTCASDECQGKRIRYRRARDFFEFPGWPIKDVDKYKFERLLIDRRQTTKLKRLRAEYEGLVKMVNFCHRRPANSLQPNPETIIAYQAIIDKSYEISNQSEGNAS